MAQLIIAAAGAAIGASIPGFGIAALGMTGASLGWTIGSIIGSTFGPTQKSEGPRLGDLRVGGSSYGAVVPWIAGSPRVAGQVIWASDRRELATTTETGSKGGGGGSEYTSYTYEVDLLIELAENICTGISRVWLNGELVYNILPTADAATQIYSDETAKWTRITFYDGNESQEPDPTYEAAVTTVLAPAYRTRSTVMIEGLQLGSSGQIPNLTFELMPGEEPRYPPFTPSSPISIGAGLEIFAEPLSADYLIVIYQDLSSLIYAQLFQLVANALTYVSATNITAVAAVVHATCRLRDGRAVFVQRYGGIDYANVISNTGATINLGTEVSLGDIGQVTLSEIGANKVIVVTYSTGITARVLELDETGIISVGPTYPAPNYPAPDGVYLGSGAVVAGLTESSAIVAYSYVRDVYSDVMGIGLTILGDAVSWGTPYVVFESENSNVGLLNIAPRLTKKFPTTATLTFTNADPGVLVSYMAVLTVGGATSPSIIMYDAAASKLAFNYEYTNVIYLAMDSTDTGYAFYNSGAGVVGLASGNAVEVSAPQFYLMHSDIAPVSPFVNAAAYRKDNALYLMQLSA